MHPNTFIFGLAALASVATSTKDNENGPRCPEDEYYNTMMESKNRHAAATDCAKWLDGTITDPNEIPKYLKDCGGDKQEDRVSRVSAACSCIATSTVSTTLSTQTHVSSTSSSVSVVTTSSQPPSHTPSTTTSSTGTHSSGPSSSQITGTSTGTGPAQTTGTLPPHTPSSQSEPPSSSSHTSPPVSTGHSGSSSTIPHSSTSSSQSTISGASTETSTASTQTVTPTKLSIVTAPGSSSTNVAPSQASTTSFTTSTIYTESIYTVTSCAPGKPDCPAASTILVTSTIAISTTTCPVTETARPNPPQQQTTTQWTTSTIYSTSTYTLTRCPPGAVNCPVSNLPITTVIPVSTTVLPTASTMPSPEHGNQEGNGNKHEGTSTQTGSPNDNQGKPSVPSTTFTMVTVPTTIHTIVNGVSAQILTVVPVTSSLTVDNHPESAQTASSSAVTSKPTIPANNTPITGSTSSRPPVVTAGAPGLVGSDGMRVAFLVFAVAALL